MTDKLFRAVIQDDEGDTTVGPWESEKAAEKRASDALSGSSNVNTWTESS